MNFRRKIIFSRINAEFSSPLTRCPGAPGLRRQAVATTPTKRVSLGTHFFRIIFVQLKLTAVGGSPETKYFTPRAVRHVYYSFVPPPADDYPAHRSQHEPVVSDFQKQEFSRSVAAVHRETLPVRLPRVGRF